MSKNRLSAFCVIALILGSCVFYFCACAFELQAEWSEYKSRHFIVFSHPNISHNYINEFIGECERYYHLITRQLGFSRFNFWLWEDRARIFIYKDRQDYLEWAGQPKWSAASVHTKKKIINTFYFEEDFFEGTLAHELTHIILREFIGQQTRVPLWFEEGVACANEKDSYRKYVLLTEGFVREANYMTVSELEKTNTNQINFPSVFYASAASLVIFLLEDYPRGDFVELCRQLRDGNSFYGAMDKVYGIKDAEDLNEKFLSFLASGK